MNSDRGRGIFITGTDTDIGKTYVARVLIQGFAPWQDVSYMKPVQTGCVRDATGDLVAPDFDYVMKESALTKSTVDEHVPYRFEPACSPHLAASCAGVTISLDHIRETFTRISQRSSITIVEGAGGVLTPLSETTSMLDLIEHLGLPVVLVTSPRVGTINHTLLTVAGLRSRQIEPAGVVMNNLHHLPKNVIYHDTIRFLRRNMPQALFLELGHAAQDTNHVEEFCHALHKRL